MENFKNRIGEIRYNNFGTPMQIVGIRILSDIDVKFLDDKGYIKKHVTYTAFKLGQVKNPYDKTTYGVGCVGIGAHKTRIGKTTTTVYNTWRDLIKRCYDIKSKDRYPAYFGICSVCEEWRDFQKFADWYEENRYKIEGRLHIDKDILCPGNKEYCPEKCLLVPQRINMLFVNLPNNEGLPNGIHRTKGGSFSASYNNKNLGTYVKLEEAYAIYATEKEKTIKDIAEMYKNVIPKKVYDALYLYKVDINNDRNYHVA